MSVKKNGKKNEQASFCGLRGKVLVQVLTNLLSVVTGEWAFCDVLLQLQAEPQTCQSVGRFLLQW